MHRFLAPAFLAVLLSAAGAWAAPLKVVGRFLQDAHGHNLMLRGMNVPVYKSGFEDDLDAVAAAVATTRANVVRFEWWAVPQPGTTEYTVANLDRAIQKYFDLGIITIVDLHDLTFQFGHDEQVGPNSDGNDQTIFASTITAYWTRPDVLAVLVKHQDHIVINVANEWGSSLYHDGTPTTTNFIQNYTTAITALRNAGIIAPLMIDAPKGFEYQFLLDHGAALLALDPKHNTMLSTHAYWAATAFTDAQLDGIVDAITASNLPIVFGEASSNAFTDIPCDPIHYQPLLTRANASSIGYVFWAWYEDGQCGQLMNITVAQDGVMVPTAANPGFGNDALHDANFGIDTATPPTTKADFSPLTGTDIPRVDAISTRMDVLTGDNVAIGGFIIGGSTPKTVVVRGRGPSLAGAGVAGVLANPTLTLVRSSDQTVIATNDDWQDAANAADIVAAGFAPGDAHESAVMMTLDPGAYTAIVSGVGGTTGVAIVEIFEVDHPEAPIVGISTRGRVDAGDNVLIGGIIVQGAAPQTVVIRARGPSLAGAGVAGVLANPVLTLVRSSDNTVVATNDDWQSGPSAAAIQAAGLQPGDPAESAILITLDPGAYTAIVSGAGGTAGVAIVEVFTTQ